MPLPYDEIKIRELEDTDRIDKEERDEPPLLAAASGVPECISLEGDDHCGECERKQDSEAAEAEGEPRRCAPGVR